MELATARNVRSESNMKAFTLVDKTNIAPGLFGLVFDLPNERANKLDPNTIGELDQILESLRSRTDIKALVLLSAKEGIFIAGADINIIQSVRTKEEAMHLASSGQAVLQKFEQMPFPTIAAINGASMGGGTELSLCCKYIITSDAPNTKIGLPEVNLGVLPGFGGTVRMPKRIGLQAALDFILTGKTMDGKKAVKLGFSDGCFPFQDFQKYAYEFGAKVARSEFKKRPLNKTMTAALLEDNPIGRAVIFSQAKKMVMARTRGKYPAALKIIETMSSNYSVPKQKALEIECNAFGDLAITDVSKRLIELFFATEKVKKMSGVNGAKLDPKDKAESVGLLGAGVMGGGIALVCAQKNIPIRMKDIDFKGLGIGMAAARKVFDELVKKKKLTKREAEIKYALISPSTDYSGLARTDVIIEAVVENMDIKKKVLKETESAMKPTSLFATNTSSLSVTEMATASSRPENVVGMHFFNPVHKMPLVEVIRGDKTSDRATMMIFELSKRMGKTPIVVKDGPGFLVNRLLMPYLNEASYLMQEGAPIEELDEHVLDFGMPMGPATLLDEIGIDVAVKVAKILHHAFGKRAEPCSLNDKLVDSKLYGKKTGKGFYLYDTKMKKQELNPDIYKVLGITPKSPSKAVKENWIPRMMYLMINEASICFAEGIVNDPMDVDLGMIMGTGFPPFRGGLLRYADAVGLKNIVAKLEEYYKSVGERYKPAQQLIERAKSGKGFYS